MDLSRQSYTETVSKCVGKRKYLKTEGTFGEQQ